MEWEETVKMLDEEIKHIHELIMIQKTGAENILKLTEAMRTIMRLRERYFS